jgi:hypothetical protein
MITLFLVARYIPILVWRRVRRAWRRVRGFQVLA